MSGNSFDKKIKDKLFEHKSDYDSGAWEKFKPMLPAPWYTTLFQNYGGWLFGGLATSALVFTFFYQNNKNNILNDEISTLKQQLASITKVDTVYIQNKIIDTVYSTKYIEKYTYSTLLPNDQTGKNSRTINELETSIGKEDVPNLAIGKDIEINSKHEKIISNQSDFVSKEEIQNAPKSTNKSTQAKPESIQNTDYKESTSNESVATIRENESKLGLEKKNNPSNIENSSAPMPENSGSEASSDSVSSEDYKANAEEKPIKDTPEKSKKKINVPKMRVGLGSDYLGLNVLTNGLNAEVFITEKLSLSTGVLFSGIRKTEHSFAKDFNNKTGKEFQREFEKYNPRIKDERPEQIRDINIRTSFIKMPINFNYYINTWSRFNFMISAGTHLDLRVYQDIDYFSGPIGDLIKDRFEAKPSPKVLNSFNYGMGVQYKYGRIVGQVMPYFDFRFRETDYFIPKSRFGLSASLKYEFGK